MEWLWPPSAPEHLKALSINPRPWHMINKAWETRARRHSGVHPHTQTRVMPSIIETINTMPRSISHPLALLLHIPPHPSGGTCVKVLDACVWSHTHRMFVLCRTSFYLVRQLTSPHISRKHSQLGDCAKQLIKCMIKNVQIYPYLNSWPFLQRGGGFCSTLMAGIQLQVRSVALSNYLLPSGAINNGRQSASLRRGKCSHL